MTIRRSITMAAAAAVLGGTAALAVPAVASAASRLSAAAGRLSRAARQPPRAPALTWPHALPGRGRHAGLRARTRGWAPVNARIPSHGQEAVN
jgi:hypothetical protein